MKKTVILVPLLLMCAAGMLHAELYYNEDQNALEMVTGIEVGPKNSCMSAPAVRVFTPPAPYNNTTFVITAPTRVAVGQEFVIDFAVHCFACSNISFWADLIPDSGQTGLVFKGASVPTVGSFNAQAKSSSLQGGMGIWKFGTPLEKETSNHIIITLKAVSEGVYNYKTIIATNPPSVLGPVVVNCCAE